MSKNICVIGGGFFGLKIAEHLAKKNYKVTLFEKENALMQRASLNNQARVHRGYHYPRSLLTAYRSSIYFSKFINEFKNCIEDKFENFYLIPKYYSNISSKQFTKFCDLINIPYNLDNKKIKPLINNKLVSDVYKVDEYIYNAETIKNILEEKLNILKVNIKLNANVISIKKNKKFIINFSIGEDTIDSEFDAIFNCTYSNINNLLNNFNNKKIYLKQELTELCIVNVPEEIKNIGITLMCGPFFSILPSALYKNNHCFSHVRYTPHFSWEEKNDEKYFDPDKVLLNYKKNSLWENMKLDGNRYIPIIKDIEYIKSIWEIKTILPKSEVDDSRPILFIEDKKKKNFFSVLGGKIDNVYDALNNIDLLKI